MQVHKFHEIILIFKATSEELQKEKQELERQIEQLKKENKKVYVKTDPDSNIIKTKEGKQAAYNVQISCFRSTSKSLLRSILSFYTLSGA